MVMYMKMKSKKVTLKDRRILVVSDIHGNGHLLKKLLKRAVYQPGEDALVILGDIIEKGNDSLGALHLVMELATNPHVYVLMGNCDAIACEIIEQNDLQGVLDYVLHAPWSKHTLIAEMCQEQGIILREDTDMKSVFNQLAQVYHKELTFLYGLDHVIESEDYIFAHAGILQDTYPYAAEIEQIIKNDRFALQDVHFDKTLICGHTPVINYDTGIFDCNPHMDHDRNIISIDGGSGVKADGQLNLLMLTDKRMRSIYEDDLNKCKVQKDYCPKEEPWQSVNWFQRELEVVKPGECTSLCRLLQNDELILIPNEFLYQGPHSICAYDFSNYHISVSEGDVVSQIQVCNDEIFIKKKGIMGWVPKDVIATYKDS